MTQDISAALDDVYRLCVRDKGFNNPLTREVASLIIRFKGVQAKRVLDEIVRAQNAQSRGVSADTTSVPTTPEPPQPKKPLPQEPKPSNPPASQKSPASASPPPPSVSPVVEAKPNVIDPEEVKGLTAMSVADKYDRLTLIATLLKVKPAEKPEGYTDRQIAAIILNQFKNADKSKRT